VRCRQKKSGVIPELARIESLEPRVLYSAEAAPWLALVDTNHPLDDTGSSLAHSVSRLLPALPEATVSESEYSDTQLLSLDATSSTLSVTQVVLVDSSHADIEELLKLLQSNLEGDAQIAIVSLEGSRDPLSSIADVLSRYDELQAVHIVSHATDGALLLGDSVIDRADLLGQAETVAQWGDALHVEGDILLYGCNLSSTAEGHLFAKTLSRITSADVASSSDITGHAVHEGDWELEVNVGSVETDVVTPARVQNDWQGSFDITTGLLHHWKLDGNGDDSAGGANMFLHNNVGSPAGLIDQAGDFNESTSLLKHGEVGVWQYSPFDESDFSISFWMHVNSAGLGAQMLGNHVAGSPGFSLYLDSDDHVVFRISDWNTSQQVVSTDAVVDGVWRHIVATRTGDTIELTVYNKATDSFDIVSSQSGGAPLSVGASYPIRAGVINHSTGDYDGLLDDIRIYNRDLSMADIGELISLADNEQVLVNNEPVELIAVGSVPVTSNDLLTIDNDTPDNQIVYSITQNGSVSLFVLNGVFLGAGDTFTQADINNGVVSVAKTATFPTSDSIEFSVDDGQGDFTSASFIVNEAAAANQPPSDVSPLTELFVSEDASPGSYVGIVVTTDADDSDHTYALLDDAGGLFTIEQDTGRIHVAPGASFNFESVSSYELEVQSTDSAGQSVTGMVPVTVTDVNDAPFLALPVQITPVVEDDITNNGDLVGDVFDGAFFDEDQGDVMTGIVVIANNSTPGTGTWQYQTVGGSWVDIGVVSKADPLVLGVDERIRYVPVSNFNGNIGTLVVHVVDDSQGSGVPLVAHRDPSLFDANGQPTTTRISLFSYGLGGVVTPVNDAPHFANVSQQLRIDENAPNGTILGTVIGHDVDDATLGYSLTGNSGGRFTIDSVTGEVSVINSAMLDYETDTFHQITVEITDSASQVFSASFAVLVNDVNEAPHDITVSAPLTVVENAVAGTVVGVVSGQDVDDATLSYVMEELDAGGRFTIDASTGEITVLDGSLLDFETGSSHTIVTQVTDSGGLTYVEYFTVSVLNEAEAPYDITATALVVDENAVAGTTVGHAWGLDVDDTPILYSLIDDASGRFSIDANTGELTVLDSSLLDHETNSSHVILVGVEDATGLRYSEYFVVAVSDVNEAPHAINITAPLSVAEDAANGDSAGAVIGTDVDDFVLSYSLTDNAGGRFAIDSNTGELLVLDSTLLDADVNTSHDITVEIEDAAGLTYSQIFTVNISNVNEAPFDIVITTPLFINENAAAGDSVGAVLGQDVDDATVSYSLANDANGRFAIDYATGEVVVLDGSQLDFETNTAHQISIEVTDAAGLSYAENFTVNITDVNEAPHAHIISSPLEVTENAANGTFIATIIGLDVDDATLTYDLMSDAGGRFAIDSATGDLSVLDGSQLDYEANSSHPITVQISDAAGLTYSVTISISVLNENEAPHSIATSAPLSVAENASNGTLFGAAVGQDVDDASLSYSLSNNANGRFAIDAASGELSVLDSSQLDFELNGSHRISIDVEDAAGLVYTDTFTVTVTDVNEAPHDITVTAPLTVVENAANGTAIGVLLGLDVDDASVSYSLLNDANGRFAIDSVTGELLVLNGSQLDYEFNGSHQVTIEVEDAAGLSYTKNFMVTVSDVNEAPHAINIIAPLSVIENAANGTSVGMVEGMDVDDTTLTYSLVSDANGRFSIDTTTGVVSVLNGELLDFEANGAHQITIAVSDQAGLSHQGNFIVRVINANDAPQLTPAFINSVAEDEAEPNGELISSTFATAFLDADNGDTLSGIGIVDNAASADGIWQYKVGVGSWQTIPTVSTSSALMLPTSAEIRFLPAENYYGVPEALTVFGFDSSYIAEYGGQFSDETQPEFADLLTLENTSANTSVSENSSKVYISVTPVNDEEQMVINTGASVVLNDTLTINNTMLAVSDVDNSSDELVFTQDGTWPGIELQVNGTSANSFTQQELDLGLVSFVSMGSVAGINVLPLIADDGAGTTTSLNFSVDVQAQVAAEPEPVPISAAVLPEPIEFIQEHVLTAIPSEPLSSVVSFTSEEQLSSDSAMTTNPDDEPSVPTSFEATGEQSESGEQGVPGLGQVVLASLQLPDFISTERTSLDAGLVADALSEPRSTIHKSIKLNAAEQVELQMASLLSLEPLTIIESSVFSSQSDNPGLQNSLDKLQQQFSKAADSMEGRAVARDSVIGISLSVTAGFLVWMLRSGALLASMFSISPLWRQLDPLPILSNNGENGKSSNGDDDNVEELFAEQSKS